MGQKVNPIGIRLGITRSWASLWYASKDYSKNLHEDLMIRRTISQRFKRAGIVKTIVERFPEKLNVSIHTVRPGVVIGQRGASIEALKNEFKKKITIPLNVNIIEVKKPETVAQIIGDNVAQQLEQRVPFRRVVKQALRGAMRGGVKGIKIAVSGRLNGADMSRTGHYKDGRIPLHTLRAELEFAESQAMTPYGVIGVKVWTYHGDVLVGKEKEEDDDYLVKPLKG